MSDDIVCGHLHDSRIYIAHLSTSLVVPSSIYIYSYKGVITTFLIFASQFDADVVACNRDPGTDMIEALDTYNLPPRTRNNLVDIRQNVQLFNSSFDGSRIICT